MAEAGRVLRLGRTKMYALVNEWRDTDGASGLRVVDFGGALRVPRAAVEAIVGGPVHVPPPTSGAVVREEPAPAAPLALVPAPDVPDGFPIAPPRTPSRRRPARPAAQLDLFDSPDAS